jgi:hypothetical protein
VNPAACTLELITRWEAVTDEIFGVWDDSVDITPDFTQSPIVPFTPGEWVPIPLSADVTVVNAGHCRLGVYNMTVFYKDDSAPLLVSASGNPFDPEMQFHIEDMYTVKNMTLSFGPIIYPGTPDQPLFVQYLSVDHGEYSPMSCMIW